MDKAVDVANRLVELNLFPVFYALYCVSVAVSVRHDIGTCALAFARRHPLACWLSTIATIYAGGILSNAALGKPILEPLRDRPALLVATAAWYLVFYAPFDFAYKVSTWPPVTLVMDIMSELTHSRIICDAVRNAAFMYPDACVMLVLNGTLRGNGTGFGKPLARLIRGEWTPTTIEFMQPSFTTRVAFLSSVIFVLAEQSKLFNGPVALMLIVICLILNKIWTALNGAIDPFATIEHLFCKVFLGGSNDVESEGCNSV